MVVDFFIMGVVFYFWLEEFEVGVVFEDLVVGEVDDEEDLRGGWVGEVGEKLSPGIGVVII